MRGTSYRTIVNRYWRMVMWNRTDSVLGRMDARLADVRYRKAPDPYWHGRGYWYIAMPNVVWTDDSTTDRTD